jgi:RNA polymerase sigma-70 factor (ECF subfamily)
MPAEDDDCRAAETASDAGPLLLRAKCGNTVALQQLVLRHHASLMGIIRTELDKKLLATFGPEDVVQEVYSESLRQFGSFEGDTPESFRHWMHAIARNKVRALHRQCLQTEKRGPEFARRASPASFSESSATLVSALEAHMSTASKKAVRLEALDALAAAVALLPDHYRQVIELRYVQERSVEETAQSTGRTRGSVLMISQRAMRQIAQIIHQFPLLSQS